MELAQKTPQISSVSAEQFLSAIDLATLLGLTDTGLSKLARSGVLVRVEHPSDSRAYLYPLFENVRRYVAHLCERKEKAAVKFLEEKARLGKISRMRHQLRHEVELGRFIPKETFVGQVGGAIVAFKEALLSRAERLEASLSGVADRGERVEVIRADDLRSLTLLAEALRAAGTQSNGQ